MIGNLVIAKTLRLLSFDPARAHQAYPKIEKILFGWARTRCVNLLGKHSRESSLPALQIWKSHLVFEKQRLLLLDAVLPQHGLNQ